MFLFCSRRQDMDAAQAEKNSQFHRVVNAGAALTSLIIYLELQTSGDTFRRI
jgi:hypothetical protein